MSEEEEFGCLHRRRRAGRPGLRSAPDLRAPSRRPARGVRPGGGRVRTDLVGVSCSIVAPWQAERPVRLAEGLYLAGDHRYTSSIQGALLSGRRAAEAILADLARGHGGLPPAGAFCLLCLHSARAGGT
ncbi:hypothetical protein BH20ACT22_BH20ACT22_16410 [soil metagenome]